MSLGTETTEVTPAPVERVWRSPCSFTVTPWNPLGVYADTLRIAPEYLHYFLPPNWRFTRRGSSWWLTNGLTRIVGDKGSPGGDKTVLVRMKVNDKGKEEVEWSQVLS